MTVLSEARGLPVPPPRTKAYEAYRATLLSPEQVRELSRLRPGRAVRDVALCWLTILAAWALVAVHPAWWTVLLAIPVVGSRYYALFIIGHDGLHRRLFPARDRNDLFNDLLILGPIGAITRINNSNHLKHHHYLATAADPDRYKHGCFNKTEAGELAGFLTGVRSVLVSLRNVFLAGAQGSPSDPEAPDAGARERHNGRDFLILGGWQAVLIGGLSWTIGFWAYPVLWLAPVYLFTFLMDNFRSFVEHSHPEADERADTHRLVTHLSNPLELMFVAPMNMNYHTTHHLWPSIPYYNLPIADHAIRSLPAADGLEWRGSYLAYLLRYSRALPLEECKAGASSIRPVGTAAR